MFLLLPSWIVFTDHTSSRFSKFWWLISFFQSQSPSQLSLWKLKNPFSQNISLIHNQLKRTIETWILQCFYVITIKCKRHLVVINKVALLDFVNFHLSRLFLHLAMWKYCRIKDHLLNNNTYFRNQITLSETLKFYKKKIICYGKASNVSLRTYLKMLVLFKLLLLFSFLLKKNSKYSA